jgi:lysozyme family protein
VTRTPPWPIDHADVLSQARFIVWELEGGKFGVDVTHDPRDRGKETKAGLTWRCYSEDFLRLPKGTKCRYAQFAALTLEDVVTVILEVFGFQTSIFRIEHPHVRLATLYFAINAGADDAVPALQRAAGVTADGVIGPVTLRAVNTHADPQLLVAGILDARYQKAARVCVATPSQLAFLHGWCVRFGRILRWRAVR